MAVKNESWKEGRGEEEESIPAVLRYRMCKTAPQTASVFHVTKHHEVSFLMELTSNCMGYLPPMFTRSINQSPAGFWVLELDTVWGQYNTFYFLPSAWHMQ